MLPLPSQQRGFLVDSSRIARERAIRANHAVAWNENGDGVASDSAANGLRGHLGNAPLARNSLRNRAIRCRCAIRNRAQNLPHLVAKRRALRAKRWQRLDSAREIALEPRTCLRDNRRQRLAA